jgi:ribokinase
MTARSLSTDPEKLRYRAMIGTGGIGSGAFFELRGNHTLGREESRAGRFLDRRDYCKLHIISHYVQTLLGREFRALPIGAVGDDDVGKKLLLEMGEAGLDTSRVATIPDKPTLYSFCFVYPDGSGGNLTTDDSASSHVDASLIRSAEGEFSKHLGRGIALAVPEVPLEARRALLKLGRSYRFLRSASFTTEELRDPLGREMLGDVDLLAVNAEEAAAAAGLAVCDGMLPELVAEGAVQRLSEAYPDMLISITAGGHGSWSWNGSVLSHCPPCQAESSSTAGAGDAHFAGILVGLTAGLPLREAQQLGTLVAGLSVTSPHTIDKRIGRETLRAFAQTCSVSLAHSVRSLLEA